MKKTETKLNNDEWLCLVPAGGLGTRLGSLTKNRAKPSQAVVFDDKGVVTRMIDIPLRAVKESAGTAIVSRCYRPETLSFIERYDFVQTLTSHITDSPIDTLLAHLNLIEQSTAEHVGLIPGDTNISAGTIQQMRAALRESGADAALLGTLHFEGHNVRPVNRKGMMCAPEEATDHIGDMGIHIFKRRWLLERLHACLNDDPLKPREVWNDIYNVAHPRGKILLYVPPVDLIDVDMGTVAAFYETVMTLNEHRRDKNGNVIFPGAELHPEATDCLALPNSRCLLPLEGVIIPEGQTVQNLEDCVETRQNSKKHKQYVLS